MSVHFNIPLTDGRALQTTSPAHRLALLRLLSARRLIAPNLVAEIDFLAAELSRQLAEREDRGEPLLRASTRGEFGCGFYCPSDDELEAFCEFCFETLTPVRAEIRYGGNAEVIADTTLSAGRATAIQRERLQSWRRGEFTEGGRYGQDHDFAGWTAKPTRNIAAVRLFSQPTNY